MCYGRELYFLKYDFYVKNVFGSLLLQNASHALLVKAIEIVENKEVVEFT